MVERRDIESLEERVGSLQETWGKNSETRGQDATWSYFLHSCQGYISSGHL